MSICNVVILLFAILIHASQASSSPSPPSPAPGPAGGVCSVVLKQAADCLPYITIGSTVSSPGNACCSELSTLVDSQGVCLCQFFLFPANFGSGFDANRVGDLPAACGLSQDQRLIADCLVGVAGISRASGSIAGGFSTALPVGIAVATVLLQMLS